MESFSFGKERLEELLGSNIKTSIDNIPNIIIKSLKKWRDGANKGMTNSYYLRTSLIIKYNFK